MSKIGHRVISSNIMLEEFGIAPKDQMLWESRRTNRFDNMSKEMMIMLGKSTYPTSLIEEGAR